MKFRRIAALVAGFSLLCACAPKQIPENEPSASIEDPTPVTKDGVVSCLRRSLTAPGAAGAAEKVHCVIEYPMLELANPDAAAVVNTYYASLAEMLCLYAENELGGLLESPQQEATITQIFEVQLLTDAYISIERCITTSLPEAETTAVYGETFRLSDGALLLPDNFFDCNASEYSKLLTDFCISALQDESYRLYPDWESAARSAFDVGSFFLSNEGYTVIYQMGVLSEEPICITVPYDALGDEFHRTIS